MIIPVSLIVPTRDRVSSLTRMLVSLKSQGALPAEIIVVDGSQGLETKTKIRQLTKVLASDQCRLTWLPAKMLGAASQRNQGVAVAVNQTIGFCDDDVLFEKSCLQRLWETLERDQKLGGVSAMITNQAYHLPGVISRTILRTMAGKRLDSYAGRILGPAVQLLPEDRESLPSVVPVEWLNLGCTLYRRAALPTPPFAELFTGYSIMEDVALSLRVGKEWRLANVRTARIFHDTQPGEHKADPAALAKMELINRHYVMTQVLGRNQTIDYLKLAGWEIFQLVVCAVNRRIGLEFWATLRGKWQGLCELVKKLSPSERSVGH